MAQLYSQCYNASNCSYLRAERKVLKINVHTEGLVWMAMQSQAKRNCFGDNCLYPLMLKVYNSYGYALVWVCLKYVSHSLI